MTFPMTQMDSFITVGLNRVWSLCADPRVGDHGNNYKADASGMQHSTPGYLEYLSRDFA